MIKSVTGPGDRNGGPAATAPGRQRRPGELGHGLPLRRTLGTPSRVTAEFSGPAARSRRGSGRALKLSFN